MTQRVGVVSDSREYTSQKAFAYKGLVGCDLNKSFRKTSQIAMKCGNKKRKHSICKVTPYDLISIVFCISVEETCCLSIRYLSPGDECANTSVTFW